MLALVSTRTATRLGAPFAGKSMMGFLKKGRANPKASRQSARQRKASNKRCSNRLRRVNRGGEETRNISELKGCFSRLVRRIRRKITAKAQAAPPSTENGVRTLILLA